MISHRGKTRRYPKNQDFKFRENRNSWILGLVDASSGELYILKIFRIGNQVEVGQDGPRNELLEKTAHFRRVRRCMWR